MHLIQRKNKNQTRNRERPSNPRPATFSYYAHGISSSDNNTGQRRNVNSDKSLKYRLRFSHIPSYIAVVATVVALGYSCLLQSDPKIVTQ